jgi:ABC-2 type transport system ATP-binding protein
MSTGQKRRLHLALAMLGDPDILVLDEPTAGLDVEGRSALHGEIRNLHKKGKTIMLASHDLAEVEELTDHIAILKDGKIAFSGSTASLRDQVGDVLLVAVKSTGNLPESVGDALGYINEDNGYRYFTCNDLGQGLVRLIDGLTNAGLTIEDLIVSKPSLEQRFLEIALKVEA